jgi:hypothetical protein
MRATGWAGLLATGSAMVPGIGGAPPLGEAGARLGGWLVSKRDLRCGDSQRGYIPAIERGTILTS